MAEENTTANAPLSNEMMDIVLKTLSDGGTLRELRGITDAELESIYASGLEYYRGGNYADARKIFNLLVTLEHTRSKYWAALGGACQALGDYAKAIECYEMGTITDLHNPKPMYYAAECFLKTGDKENAIRALNSLKMFGPTDTAVGKEYQAKGEALRAKVEAA